MPPLIALGVALTTLGLLAMLGAAALFPVPVQSRWHDRIFGGGYAIFCLALTFWLIVSVAAFFAEARVHGL